MPTYEYKREDGSVFEFSQSINDKPLQTCPTTGQAVKRIISGGGGVIYKGSGWYVTDYKKNNNEPAPAKTAPEKPEIKTETSPESSTPAE